MSDMSKVCRLLAESHAKDERVVESLLNVVREAKRRRRQSRTPRRGRPQLTVDEPGVSLQEAIRRAPNAVGPSRLPGEAVRQHEALAKGKLGAYLERRRRLVGF